jgi:hypothetical protein
VYIFPRVTVELKLMFLQMPTPFIIVANFNATKKICGGSDLSDERGKVFSDVLAGLNLILLNTGANTPLSLAPGTSFCLRS